MFQTSIRLEDVSINPEYEKMVPPHSKEKYEELKQSISENGLYEDIIINELNEVLDGHHRLRACKDVNVLPRFQIKKFDSKDKERLYVMETNLYRRQLTVFQEIELRNEIAKLQNRQGFRSDLTSVPNGTEVVGTRGRIAVEMPNAGERTIARALYVMEHATGEIGEKIKQEARLGTTRVA